MIHFPRGNFEQFEDMYEQRRTEVNKAAEKYEKQIKAAKRSGNKANQVKLCRKLRWISRSTIVNMSRGKQIHAAKLHSNKASQV